MLKRKSYAKTAAKEAVLLPVKSSSDDDLVLGPKHHYQKKMPNHLYTDMLKRKSYAKTAAKEAVLLPVKSSSDDDLVLGPKHHYQKKSQIIFILIC